MGGAGLFGKVWERIVDLGVINGDRAGKPAGGKREELRTVVQRWECVC